MRDNGQVAPASHLALQAEAILSGGACRATQAAVVASGDGRATGQRVTRGGGEGQGDGHSDFQVSRTALDQPEANTGRLFVPVNKIKDGVLVVCSLSVLRARGVKSAFKKSSSAPSWRAARSCACLAFSRLRANAVRAAAAAAIARVLARCNFSLSQLCWTGGDRGHCRGRGFFQGAC
eukprot:scaffold80544_cov61-Phaeocystis_antarctica.AAC.8